MCDILLRPGVHIITLCVVGLRQKITNEPDDDRDGASALALIDNCDKNVADEK